MDPNMFPYLGFNVKNSRWDPLAPSSDLCIKSYSAIPEDNQLQLSPVIQIYLRLSLYRCPELMNPC